MNLIELRQAKMVGVDYLRKNGVSKVRRVYIKAIEHSLFEYSKIQGKNSRKLEFVKEDIKKILDYLKED